MKPTIENIMLIIITLWEAYEADPWSVDLGNVVQISLADGSSDVIWAPNWLENARVVYGVLSCGIPRGVSLAGVAVEHPGYQNVLYAVLQHFQACGTVAGGEL